MDSALILEFSRRVRENIKDFDVPFQEAVTMTKEEFKAQSIKFVCMI